MGGGDFEVSEGKKCYNILRKFTENVFQDCSEFMSYLMDICHEEQRASFALSNSMKQHSINKGLIDLYFSISIS